MQHTSHSHAGLFGVPVIPERGGDALKFGFSGYWQYSGWQPYFSGYYWGALAGGSLD
jgi:hypothetical protein